MNGYFSQRGRLDYCFTRINSRRIHLDLFDDMFEELSSNNTEGSIRVTRDLKDRITKDPIANSLHRLSFPHPSKTVTPLDVICDTQINET